MELVLTLVLELVRGTEVVEVILTFQSQTVIKDVFSLN